MNKIPKSRTLSTDEVSNLFSPLHFLVIDDMEPIRRMIKQMLLLMGVGGRIEEAVDGVEAWDRLTDFTYDVVICDINIPRLNGLELLQVMRASPQYERLS